MLLNSWAMPPAKRPKLSSFWAWRSALDDLGAGIAGHPPGREPAHQQLVVRQQQAQLQVLPAGITEERRKAGQKDVAVVRMHELGEGPLPQLGYLMPDQFTEGAVGLEQAAFRAEHHEPDRRLVEEVEVAVAGLLQILLRAAQLVVLQLQLDLVDLQFLDQPLRVLLRRRRRHLFAQ